VIYLLEFTLFFPEEKTERWCKAIATMKYSPIFGQEKYQFLFLFHQDAFSTI